MRPRRPKTRRSPGEDRALERRAAELRERAARILKLIEERCVRAPRAEITPVGRSTQDTVA